MSTTSEILTIYAVMLGPSLVLIFGLHIWVKHVTTKFPVARSIKK